ncbi:MAG: hypothetical protein U0M60_16760 [Clostridia bacterium]|nr:hypothetical protein [Clostridia bacterium]
MKKSVFKKTKRMLSLSLACAMTVGALGTVTVSAERTSAQSGYFSGDINVFNSFADYSKTEAAPDGFINLEAGRHRTSGTKYEDEIVRHRLPK